MTTLFADLPIAWRVYLVLVFVACVALIATGLVTEWRAWREGRRAKE